MRLLDLLDAHLREQPFLMGQRPGASDFALYGQLSQLAHFDPTSMELTLQRSPRVFAWVDLVEDLSGLEPRDNDWACADPMAPTLLALLQELSQAYVPVMLANARAHAAGDKELSADLPAGRWQQAVVPYQTKCLRWLRAQYAALGVSDQRRAAALLQAAEIVDLVDAAL